MFLRRPPSENQQYRFDRMLKAAAERGVKVNVIAFKEVPILMSRKFWIYVLSSLVVSSLFTNMNEDHSFPYRRPDARVYIFFMDFKLSWLGPLFASHSSDK